MTRNGALIGSLGALLLLIFGVTTLAFDPFNVRGLWRQISSATSPYEDPGYLYEQAQYFYKNDDRMLARDIARRVLVVQPEHRDAHKLLAAIYLKNQDFPAALAESREAARIDPTDVTSRLGMAAALREMGLSERAAGVLESVIQSQHGTPSEREEAEYRLGQIQRQPKEPGEPADKP